MDVIEPTKIQVDYEDTYYNGVIDPKVYLTNYLAKELLKSNHIHFQEWNKYGGPYTTMRRATLLVVPPTIKRIVRDNQYTFKNNSFTEAEIQEAILNTFPERFI